MRKFSVLLLLIPLLLLAGLYFLFSYANGGICFEPSVCTKDIRTLCSLTHTEIWQGPSLCSCGLDTAVLKSRGWIECKIPEGYEGKIQTRAAATELPSMQILKTLSLFIVPTIFLSIGIGTIRVLWTKRSD